MAGNARSGPVDLDVTVDARAAPVEPGRAGPDCPLCPIGQRSTGRASGAAVVWRGNGAAAMAARTTSRVATAPALSSGSLPLPHFGDCTHDGQPDSHPQPAI